MVKINEGKRVRYEGKSYGPGDEDALGEAMGAEDAPDLSTEALTERGVIGDVEAREAKAKKASKKKATKKAGK